MVHWKYWLSRLAYIKVDTLSSTVVKSRIKKMDIKHSKPIRKANTLKTGRKDCYTVVNAEKMDTKQWWKQCQYGNIWVDIDKEVPNIRGIEQNCWQGTCLGKWYVSRYKNTSKGNWSRARANRDTWTPRVYLDDVAKGHRNFRLIKLS